MANRSLPEMPCGPILELHGQRKRFHIPFGLKALLEDMTREVLRSQPQNVYDFLAVFMEARLRKKQEEEEKRKERKSWKQHRWSWQASSVLPQEELKEFLGEFHTPVEEANHHAVVIQSAYRGYMARKKVKDIRKSMKGDAAPANAEGGGEGDTEGGKRKSWQATTWTEDRKSILNPEELEEFLNDLSQAGVPKDKVEEKAIVIQSAFRAYQARKKVKDIRKSRMVEKDAANSPDSTTEKYEEQTAAVTVEEPSPVSDSPPEDQTTTGGAAPEPEPGDEPPVEEAPPADEPPPEDAAPPEEATETQAE